VPAANLSGTVNGVSTVVGTLRASPKLSGTVVCTSTVVGSLKASPQLSGVVNGVSTVTATVSAPLATLSHEPGWIYATPSGPLQANELTQFLTMHGITVVGQGAIVASVTGGLTTWQELGEVDQPFVAPANVGWFRIPLSSTDLSPIAGAGWSNPAPITVSLYTDSSGVPGTLVATTTIPANQIAAVQGSNWPEPNDLLFGPAVADSQASLPQLPGSGWFGITPLVAGAWGVLFATQPRNNTQMWVVPYDGSDLGGWIDGSTLPISGISQAVYAPNSQVVAVVGSDQNIYAATFSQTGVVGSWQQLPIIAGFGSGLIGILTYGGQDYLVAVASSGLTYYAALSASGSVTSWTSGPTFPVGYTSGVAYQVGSDLVFIVQSGGLSTLVSVTVPGEGWTVSGTLSASSSAVLGVIGPAVITTNGTAIDATTLTELGTAPWSLPIPLGVSGANVTLLAFESGTGYAAFWIPTTVGDTGYQQPAYVPFWVNVPLPEALTASATYHLVMSATEALTVGTAVPVVTPTSGPSGLFWNGSAWVALGGAVPILAFYGVGQPPLALIGMGKTTILWFDTPSGALTTATELVGGTSESRVVSYDDGVLTGVA
jgi:hypothetical protein